MAMNPMAGMGRPPAMGGMPPSMGVAPMGQAPTAQGNSGIMPSVQSIKTLTETLRYMPEAELHQYAAMHRNDPFVFPLAFQVSQARQQMRAGQAAQMAGQKPPSVVDQDLAQMAPQTLPEDQGIGALNAPNLQNMADGGIAGYADGGQQPGMFNYAQMAPAVDLHPDSGVTPRSMAGGGIAHFAGGDFVRSTNGGKTWFLDVPEEVRDPSVPYYRLIPNPAAELNKREFKSSAEAAKAYDEKYGAKPALATDTTKPTGIQTVAPNSGADLGPEYDKFLEKPPLEQKEKPYSLPVPQAPAGLGGKQLQSLIAPTSIEDMKKAQSAFRVNPNQVIDPFQAERKNIVESQQRMTEEELRNFETSQKERGDVYANRKERLAGQEGKLKGKEQENQGLSLLEAGLVIFGGTSPFAGANIGEGKVGIKSYREGQDKIERARDRLSDAKDRIEDLETNYKDMSDRERRGLKSNINKATTDGQRLMLDGVTQAYGMDRADATNLTKTYLENADKAKTRGLQALISSNEQAGANYRTQLGLTAMPEQVKMAKLLGGPTGDLEIGLKRLTEIQAGKLNPIQEYLKYQLEMSKTKDPFTGQPLPTLGAKEFFDNLADAQKALAAMGGPGKLKNTAPQVLRPDN